MAPGVAGSKPGGKRVLPAPGPPRVAGVPVDEPALVPVGGAAVPRCVPMPAAGAVALAARLGAVSVVVLIWAKPGRLQDRAVVISKAAGTLRRLR